MLTLRGKIVFENGKPSSIPDGSVLTVKFQDTNRCDAPAVTLGMQVQTIKGYNGEDLTFEIKDAKKPDFVPTGTFSAVLNMGWIPSGDDWIHKGDYLNDTVHSLTIEENILQYNDYQLSIKQYT